jgi:diguanylate cyclase (GGDEF)-like protein
VEVELFPSSNEPEEDDELGRRALRQGGPRLYPDAASRLPSRGAGRLLLLPLRVRESVIGWISLSRPPAEKPFDFQDLRLSVIAVDLTAMALGNAERYAQIESLAVSDGLTGLFTRGYLDERLQEEFAKARHQGQLFSVMLLDVDHFKRINDSHGHRLGDEVLRWLARQIMAQCRDTDFVARYGGEEFVVLMPNTGGKDALGFGRRMAKNIADAVFRWEKTSLKVTVSGGVAALSPDVADEKELLDRADKALYAAKNGGRNLVLDHE